MRMKRPAGIALALSILLFNAVSAFSIPASFCDDSEGFLELNVFVTWDFSEAGPGFGAEFGGGGEGFWGLDFGVSAYPVRGLFAYVGGQYFLNPTISDFYSIPLRLRVGAVIRGLDVSFGFTALGGVSLYPVLLRYDDDEEEDIALAAGGSIGFNYWNGAFFPSAEALASFAMSLAPSDGGIYYYYY